MPDEPNDTPRATAVVLTFGVALTATGLLFPLIALDAGFGPAAVGAFTAVSAGAQLTVRLLLPWLLARLPDRQIIAGGCLLLAGSAAALLAGASAPLLLAAQVAQGSGRALFWTASQTHAVRSPGVAVRRLAQVQVASNVASLIGPTAAGVVAHSSLRGALALPIAAALTGAALTPTLARLAPYQRQPREGRRGAWRRSARSLGNWTSFAGGGWRGLMDSFVPVVLAGAGLSSATIGLLVSVADGAPLLATSALARWGGGGLSGLSAAAATAMVTSAVALPPVAGRPLAAGAVLALGGAAGGVAATLGQALVSEDADDGEQGTALAAAGAYRAAARMASPSLVGALGQAVGVAAAMAVSAAGMAAPVIGLAAGRRRAPRSSPHVSEVGTAEDGGTMRTEGP